MADVAALTASVSILLKLFPTKVATVISWSEMFFGLGLMMGPALGAALFSAGGFKLPFLVVGSIAVVIALTLIFVIPNIKPGSIKETYDKKRLSFKEVIKVDNS